MRQHASNDVIDSGIPLVGIETLVHIRADGSLPDQLSRFGVHDVDPERAFVIGLDVADRGKGPMRAIADVILRGGAPHHVLHARVVGDEKVRAAEGGGIPFRAQVQVDGPADPGIDQRAVNASVACRFLCAGNPGVGVELAEIRAPVVIKADVRRRTTGGPSGQEHSVEREAPSHRGRRIVAELTGSQ
jgi:hypothetical protein